MRDLIVHGSSGLLYNIIRCVRAAERALGSPHWQVSFFMGFGFGGVHVSGAWVGVVCPWAMPRCGVRSGIGRADRTARRLMERGGHIRCNAMRCLRRRDADAARMGLFSHCVMWRQRTCTHPVSRACTAVCTRTVAVCTHEPFALCAH